MSVAHTARRRKKYIAMSSFLINLKEIYREYFPNNFVVEPKTVIPEKETTVLGSPVVDKSDILGRTVFLPITLNCGQEKLTIPCATIRIIGQKTIVRTAISERRGTVKEQFSVGDYEFAINGVLVADKSMIPDKDILMLKNFYESTVPVELHNAISDFFLDSSCQVCITALEFPETQGKTVRHRPFSLTCESDYVNTLTLDD